MSGFRELAQNVLPEDLEHLWHCDHYGYASGVDLPHNFVRAISAHEDRYSGNEWQNKEREHLAEHVTEWDQAQKTQRKSWSKPFGVSGNNLLRRHNIGQNISVRDDDSLRFSSRTGSEYDLSDVVSLDGNRRRFAALTGPLEFRESPSGRLAVPGGSTELPLRRG